MIVLLTELRNNACGLKPQSLKRAFKETFSIPKKEKYAKKNQREKKRGKKKTFVVPDLKRKIHGG